MFRRIAWFFTGLFFTVITISAYAEMVSVSIKEANLRSGPSSNHQVEWKVIQGFPLEVVSRQGNWIQVKDFEGDITWIYADSVGNTPYVIVTGDTVNLRAEPNTSARIIGKVEYGTVLQRLETRAGWVKVKLGQTVGWISADFVWGNK